MKSTRKNSTLNDQTRTLIINKIENLGEPIVKVARDLQVNEKTVASVLRLYRATGRIEKLKQKGHAKTKITAEISMFIERQIERDKSVTLKMIKQAIYDNHHLNVAISTIHLHLEHLRITLKRSGIILDRVNDAIRVAQRKEFATYFLTYHPTDDKKNIFVDECGFNLHLRRNYARSVSGTRVNNVVPTVRGRNTTLLMAISGQQVVHYKLISGSCNSEIFSQFLIDLDHLLLSTHGINDGFIVMDNARPHTAKLTTETIKVLSNSAKFLSPYSFMLNPIEFSFSKIKTKVRSLLGQGETDLIQVIPTAIASVTPDDCQGWYRLIRRNCALAMQEHSFE